MNQDSIPGWFDYEALFDDMVERAPDGVQSRFVEVGCWLGRSTAYLARKIKDSGKPIQLFAVDHGFGSPGGEDYHLHEPILRENGGNVFGKFVTNLRDCGVLDAVTPICADSIKAADLFPAGSLDFVFIDAAHDPDSVKTDLETWWPRVTTGGVMAGHDYNGCWLGVAKAVDAFFGVKPTPPDVTDFALRDPSSGQCWSRLKKFNWMGRISHGHRTTGEETGHSTES